VVAVTAAQEFREIPPHRSAVRPPLREGTGNHL